MTATVYHLPSPKVRRALEETGIIGALALDAWRSGDRELVHDCERWHEQRQTIINGARRGYQRQAVHR